MTTQELIEKKYMEEFGRLVKIYTNRAGSVQNAEDVVHDAFERALRYQRSFSPLIQEFGAWFNSIINNALREYKRKEKLLGMSVDLDEEEEAGCYMQEWELDMVALVKWELSKRPMPTRQALHLYFFEQYKPREIAQVLDISNGYIRVAVNDFKKLMREKHGEIMK